MPFNGSGSFSLIYNWQNDAAQSINISSSRMMGQENDIAAGLSLCITKDGQQTPTANLPMGGFRFTNMGNANAQGNAVTVQDVQNGSVTSLTSVSGTDTITANTAPSIGSYAAGQAFDFIATGANTTTTVTLNINGLGAKNITKNGAAALAIGDIQNGQSVRVRYDGTQFQMISPLGQYTGRLLRVVTITSTQTYNPGVGTKSVKVRLLGGGGSGAGCPANGASQASAGSGGSAGAYAEGFFTSGFSGVTVTIGSGGTAASGGSSNGGGTSSFGALMNCTGGPGGSAVQNAAPFTVGGPTGGSASGSGYLNVNGAPGGVSIAISNGTGYGGLGANSPFGAGGAAAAVGNNGQAATNFGAGGGGVMQGASGVVLVSGAGAPGLCIIEEYGTI